MGSGEQALLRANGNDQSRDRRHARHVQAAARPDRKADHRLTTEPDKERAKAAQRTG
jgi:hypothetical protein